MGRVGGRQLYKLGAGGGSALGGGGGAVAIDTEGDGLGMIHNLLELEHASHQLLR
jgi:hypothetical protein